MDYKILDVLTLEDKNNYVIVDICDYNNHKYAFLADIHNKSNYIYVELMDNDVMALGSESINLIYELTKIFAHDSSRVIKEINDESGK